MTRCCNVYQRQSWSFHMQGFSHRFHPRGDHAAEEFAICIDDVDRRCRAETAHDAWSAICLDPRECVDEPVCPERVERLVIDLQTKIERVVHEEWLAFRS